MSQNPTYDPEPGYGMYDQSGHSTPPTYYNSSPQPAADQFSNMASYRQATNGPPAQSGGDPSNGKSYRYATEAIPEDEDEPDQSPPAEYGRQVQFSNGGEPTKRVSQHYEDGCWDRYKVYILAALAVLFAILWVIFLGLFIRELLPNQQQPGDDPQTGESKEVSVNTFFAQYGCDISGYIE